eukprot:10603728-Alexandrium_andersonii.AAC.1
MLPQTAARVPQPPPPPGVAGLPSDPITVSPVAVSSSSEQPLPPASAPVVPSRPVPHVEDAPASLAALGEE